MFDGLIITRGPSGARFVIGICWYEQNVWYEPMTPTTRSLRENAFAFVPAAEEEVLRAGLRRRGIARLEADRESAGLEPALLEDETDPTHHRWARSAARRPGAGGSTQQEVRRPAPPDSTS